MENYCKGYHLYVIEPTGEVTEVPYGMIAELDTGHRSLVFDHCFHPLLLERLATKIGGIVDGVSLEVVTGRWMFEYYDKETAEI